MSKHQALDLVASIFTRAGRRLADTPTPALGPTKENDMSIIALHAPEPMDEPTITVETITPETAAKWIEHDTANRNPRPSQVAKIASDMAAGQFILNGETIKVTWYGMIPPDDGVVVDGGHRLRGLVKYGQPIRLAIAWNVPLNSQPTIDDNVKRTFGDTLRWMGETDYVSVAAAVNSLHRFKFGDGYKGIGNSQPTPPSKRELLDVLDNHPDIRRSTRLVSPLCKKLRSTKGPIAALHYIMWELSPEDADEFFRLLHEGTNMDHNNPIMALRRAWEKDLTALRRMPQRHRIALTIKAWNKWMMGESAEIIFFRGGGKRAEDFPTPIGPNDLAG